MSSGGRLCEDGGGAPRIPPSHRASSPPTRDARECIPVSKQGWEDEGWSCVVGDVAPAAHGGRCAPRGLGAGRQSSGAVEHRLRAVSLRAGWNGRDPDGQDAIETTVTEPIAALDLGLGNGTTGRVLRTSRSGGLGRAALRTLPQSSHQFPPGLHIAGDDRSESRRGDRRRGPPVTTRHGGHHVGRRRAGRWRTRRQPPPAGGDAAGGELRQPSKHTNSRCSHAPQLRLASPRTSRTPRRHRAPGCGCCRSSNRLVRTWKPPPRLG